MTSHKDLNVWKGGIKLTSAIYQLTSKLPREEQFGLQSQLRRAAVSIPTNISEGSARQQTKEFIRFLRIASGSLAEIETLLIISCELKYFTELQVEEVFRQIHLINKQLTGLVKSMNQFLE